MKWNLQRRDGADRVHILVVVLIPRSCLELMKRRIFAKGYFYNCQHIFLPNFEYEEK